MLARMKEFEDPNLGIYFIQTQKHSISPVCISFLPVRLSPLPLPLLCLLGPHWNPVTSKERLSFRHCRRDLTVPCPLNLGCNGPSSQGSVSCWEKDQNSRKGLRLITVHCALPFKWYFCFNSCFGPLQSGGY